MSSMCHPSSFILLFRSVVFDISISCVFYSVSCTCDIFNQSCFVFDQLCVLFNQLYMLLFPSVVFDCRSIVCFLQSVVHATFSLRCVR